MFEIEHAHHEPESDYDLYYCYCYYHYYYYYYYYHFYCRKQEEVADMLGITRLEPDGPPAPLYPPGQPHFANRNVMILFATMTKFSCIQASLLMNMPSPDEHASRAIADSATAPLCCQFCFAQKYLTLCCRMSHLACTSANNNELIYGGVSYQPLR